MSTRFHAGRLAGPLLLAAVAAVPIAMGVAPASPAGAPQRPSPPVPQSVDGVVDGYNLDPHGMVNSVVVKTNAGRLAQFNLPPALGAILAGANPVGQKVTASGVPEVAVGDRTLYRLTRLAGTDGKPFDVGGPGTGRAVHVDGTIKRLNVAPRGEIDGALLDTGDYVHTGPRAAATLTVGAKLTADGMAQPMLDGHQAIEATTVNGTAVPPPPPPPHGHPDGPGGPPPLPPGGPAAAPAPGAPAEPPPVPPN